MNEQRLVLGKLQDLVASNAEVVRALAASHLIRLPIGYGRAFVFLPESPSLRFLEHKMGRVVRTFAFGYGKPQRMKVQTVEQQLSLTEKNGYRRNVERVD